MFRRQHPYGTFPTAPFDIHCPRRSSGKLDWKYKPANADEVHSTVALAGANNTDLYVHLPPSPSPLLSPSPSIPLHLPLHYSVLCIPGPLTTFHQLDSQGSPSPSITLPLLYVFQDLCGRFRQQFVRVEAFGYKR